MTVGSLFAGIGGFDLGFEWAGFEIRWQVEIDPFCRAVLAQHWPDVRRYEDVRHCHGGTTHVADAAIRRDERSSLQAGELFQSGGCGATARVTNHCAICLAPVDVICGGFPCQPHSLAGRRGGAQDERDLWPEFARLIRELKPRWVVAENVPGLLSSDAGRFFGTVLGDLAACGYNAEWDCLPASAFGAPHRRDRVWIVAYPASTRWRSSRATTASEARSGRAQYQPGGTSAMADTDLWRGELEREGELAAHQADLADAHEPGSQGRLSAGVCERPDEWPTGPNSASARIFTDANGTSLGRVAESWRERGQWESEPDVGRVAHGVPARVDRLRSLGNSIVPQIAEWIARRIAEAESQ